MDLDGTLVHDGNITAEDRLAVENTISKGIPVIPATTRMRFSAYILLQDLPVTDVPLICLNGAMVIGPGWHRAKEEDGWMERKLEMPVARKISEYADIMGYEITTIFSERKYWKERRDLPVISSSEDPVAHIIESNMQALERGPPVSYMMHTEVNGDDCVEDMERFVNSRLKEYTCTHRHHRMGELKAITIYPQGTSKGKGVELVCKRLNISVKDVMAIGDDEVDIPMLKTAGTGIAMGNSPDSVRRIADHVVPSCQEGGVAHALGKYIH